MNRPLITVITVCYNAGSIIEKTILSVINQTYPNIEYIVIDGGSSDNTLDIIKKYVDKIHYWISEPDKGIYDAMNKGIQKATGEWINFMNCGDSFYSTTTIEETFKLSNPKSDIIYGDINLLYEFGNFTRLATKTTEKNYMPFYHQASFSRRTLLQESLFNLKYKICADKNFFYQMFKRNKIFEYINITIANYEAENGVSSTNKIRFKQEIGQIENKTSNIKWKISFVLFKYITFFKNQIKKRLPVKLVNTIKEKNVKKYIAQY